MHVWVLLVVALAGGVGELELTPLGDYILCTLDRESKRERERGKAVL